MTVTLRKPDSVEYRKFSEQVKERAREDYGDSVYGKEEVSYEPEVGFNSMFISVDVGFLVHTLSR